MAKKKLDRTLPQQSFPKPAFQMAEPNDDMAAFGWDLSKIRYPAPGLKRGDVWSGPPIWSVPISREILDSYGPDMQFLAPKFIQFCLDNSPEVQNAVEKTKAARYTKAALAELQATIMRVFKTKIVPDIIKRFENVADGIADFYAAKLAHITKFGPDEEEPVK
jgi:hypothetical protein